MRSYVDAVSDALERMEELGFERRIGGGDAANHGPMGAEALATLGFTDEVGDWVERYKRATPHHAPPEPRWRIDAADEGSWRPVLGRIDRAGDWEQLFTTELRERPWREVLAQWWPRLIPGLLCGLTHGLIRTAHAVRGLAGQHEPTDLQLRELARGLAYWAARYVQLPGQARLIGSESIAQAVAALPRLPVDRLEAPWFPAQRLLRLQNGDPLPGYHDALTALAPDRAQWMLSQMTSTFAGLYLAHPEAPPVPLVHGVTAPAAIRLVLPHLPDHLHTLSIAAMWQVHVALVLAFTCDRGSEVGQQPSRLISDTPNSAALMTVAFEHGDEHVIKFTEACLRENALNPDPCFLAAARSATRRIPVAKRDASGVG